LHIANVDDLQTRELGMGEEFRVKLGGVYKDRIGGKHGPLFDNNDPVYPFTDGIGSWTAEGRFVFEGDEVDSDLIEELPASAPAAPGEPRCLRVSVWFGFAPVVADVVAHGREGPVDIKFASLEPKSYPGRISLEREELEKLAIVRSTGPITLLAAIEERALEEAFA